MRSNFKGNALSLGSYFLSVIVIRVLSTGNFNDVFTEDATKLAFGFLILSLVILIFSSIDLRYKIISILHKYARLKRRFRDLLDRKDIKGILNNDREFKAELKYVKKRARLYTYLWIVTLVIFIGIIFSLSTYVNWQSIYRWIVGTVIKLYRYFSSII